MRPAPVRLIRECLTKISDFTLKPPAACARQSAIGGRREQGTTASSAHHVPRWRLELRCADRFALELQTLLQVGLLLARLSLGCVKSGEACGRRSAIDGRREKGTTASSAHHVPFGCGLLYSYLFSCHLNKCHHDVYLSCIF